MYEISTTSQDRLYPEIITYDEINPCMSSPYSETDLQFYQTKETLMDVDVYRNFLKNVERRFRASREYKAYKSYLIENYNMQRCQILGNISVDDATIELHHNVLGLFDICLLISSHVINTVGYISSFDLIQLLIQEHYNNRVGVTFLCKTAHQLYTNDDDGYIEPESTFGKWWELLSMYKYGITFSIANKVITYINKYNKELQGSINIMQNDEIMSFAWANEYGMPVQQIGLAIPEEAYNDFLS